MRILLVGFLILANQLSWADDFAASAVPLIQKHCVTCHGPDKSKGGITLHDITTEGHAFQNFELIQNALEQIELGDMPPDDEEVLPTPEEKAELLQQLKSITKRVVNGEVPQKAGRVTLRRLNRTEYHYTVKDLFGVTFNPSKDFPVDGAGGEGFDNTADALFSSPALLEKYLAAAHKVIAAVYDDSRLVQKIIFAQPESPSEIDATAKKVLTYHASRAYRRRVSDEDMAPLLSAFSRGVTRGLTYQDALRAPLTALLVNPRFLFRAEHNQKDHDEWQLNDFEIATRLSYFLWSSMPDRELFRLADQGKLTDPDVLRQQTQRMLASPKSKALARHFGGQWIGFDKMIDHVQPDKKRFPGFSLNLRKAMYHEGVEFMHHLITEDRPIYELIDSDYTFANQALAQHYGLSTPVSGAALRKVPIQNEQRGGVLGMGGVLASTSLPMRTSPVLRGVWILDSLLGDPAPPPPPDAGELPADDTKAGGLTFREQLDAHRQSKSCASCHARIDPLGFSLENFDAIGRWRDRDANGKPIDSSATLPGNISFSSPKELKTLLMDSKDKFARNMIRKGLSYAIGRGLEYYDEAIVNDILTTVKTNNYSTQSLIHSIIRSRPFLKRSSTR